MVGNWGKIPVVQLAQEKIFPVATKNLAVPKKFLVEQNFFVRYYGAGVAGMREAPHLHSIPAIWNICSNPVFLFRSSVSVLPPLRTSIQVTGLLHC